MAKRRMGIILALLLCLSLVLMPCTARADSTSDAKEPIDTDRDCTLTVGYGYDGIAFSGEHVVLYQVAEVSEDFQYTLTAPFAASNLILNGIQTNGEWNVIRSTLESYLLTHPVEPVQTVFTDEAGQARFTPLNPGLYLVSSVTVVQDQLTCYFASALVALPGLGEDGTWQDQVTITAKSEVLPPIEPDEELQLKILKLWKGDEGSKSRPGSIEVEIFKDGISYQRVTLSEANNWSYSWTVKADGAMWNVVEKNVPEGYTMTVEQKDTSFVITNTSQKPPTPKPPQTGDTNNVMVYTLVMYAAGILLVILGLLGKRNGHEEAKEI